MENAYDVTLCNIFEYLNLALLKRDYDHTKFGLVGSREVNYGGGRILPLSQGKNVLNFPGYVGLTENVV